MPLRSKSGGAFRCKPGLGLSHAGKIHHICVNVLHNFIRYSYPKALKRFIGKIGAELAM
jgi:hypothetical protein